MYMVLIMTQVENRLLDFHYSNLEYACGASIKKVTSTQIHTPKEGKYKFLSPTPDVPLYHNEIQKIFKCSIFTFTANVL